MKIPESVLEQFEGEAIHNALREGIYRFRHNNYPREISYILIAPYTLRCLERYVLSRITCHQSHKGFVSFMGIELLEIVNKGDKYLEII